MIRKLKAQKKVDLLLDGGRFLFQSGRLVTESRKKQAEKIFQAYKKMGYDLAGIGVDDLSAGCSFLKKLDPEGSLLASACLYCSKRPAFSPFRIFEIRGIKIAVIGLSGGTLPVHIPGGNETALDCSNPALERYMEKIRQNANLIVVLSSLSPKEEMAFIRKYPAVSLIISSGRTFPTWVPVKWHDSLIVSSHPRGKSVGLIRLFIKKDRTRYSIARYENKLFVLEKGR